MTICHFVILAIRINRIQPLLFMPPIQPAKLNTVTFSYGVYMPQQFY